MRLTGTEGGKHADLIHKGTIEEGRRTITEAGNTGAGSNVSGTRGDDRVKKLRNYEKINETMNP